MAKILTEDEIKKLEEQAKIKQRADAASKVLNPSLAESEAARREAWHQSNMDARRRTMESKAATAASDPGRYSPQERQAAIDWLNRGEDNRRFDVEQKTRLQESEDRRNGAIHAGEGAAERKAAAEEAIAKLEHGYDDWDYVDGKKVWTHHAGSRETVAGKEAAIRELESKARYGTLDKDGNYTPGSEVHAAKESGNWRLQQQELKNQGAETVATTQGAAAVDAAKVRAEAQAKRQAQIDAKNEQKAFEAYDRRMKDLMNTNVTPKQRAEWNALNPDEKRAQWLKSSGRRQQTHRPEVMTGSDGVVYEIFRDANGRPTGRNPIK